MIKWLLFDLGNVIVHHVLEGKEYYKVNGLLLEGSKIESIYCLEEYKDFSRGLLKERDFVELFLKNSGLKLDLGDFLNLYEKDIRLIGGMKGLLKTLNKKYSLAILTNESKEWADRKVDSKKLRVLFEKIIISGEIGMLKPSPEFYVQSLKILNAKASECLFIDDQEKNCKAAENIGIKSIQFKNFNELKKDLAFYLLG